MAVEQTGKRRIDLAAIQNAARSVRAEPGEDVSRRGRNGPSRAVFAERAGRDWHTITYEDTRRQVDAIAASLIERGLSADRPVMILSGNAIDHALLMIGWLLPPAFRLRRSRSPIRCKARTTASSRTSPGCSTPGLVYVADTAPFAKALAALDLAGCRGGGRTPTALGLEGVTPFAELAATPPGRAVEAGGRGDYARHRRQRSCSRRALPAFPRGVINTHRMLTVNQQQMAQVWPFMAEQHLVMVDRMPRTHTFGGNHDINMVLRNAGTLYIDAGRPVPALLGETLRNLREVSPTIYLSVPAGYAALLPHLEKDEALARSFFARLRLIFYAGAALPQDLWDTAGGRGGALRPARVFR